MAERQLLLIRGDEELLIPLVAGAVWVEVADLLEQGWQIAPDEQQPTEAKPKTPRSTKKLG